MPSITFTISNLPVQLSPLMISCSVFAVCVGCKWAFLVQVIHCLCHEEILCRGEGTKCWLPVSGFLTSASYVCIASGLLVVWVGEINYYFCWIQRGKVITTMSAIIWLHKARCSLRYVPFLLFLRTEVRKQCAEVRLLMEKSALRISKQCRYRNITD